MKNDFFFCYSCGDDDGNNDDGSDDEDNDDDDDDDDDVCRQTFPSKLPFQLKFVTKIFSRHGDVDSETESNSPPINATVALNWSIMIK